LAVVKKKLQMLAEFVWSFESTLCCYVTSLRYVTGLEAVQLSILR